MLGLFSHVRFQPTGGNRKQLKIQVREERELICYQKKIVIFGLEESNQRYLRQ